MDKMTESELETGLIQAYKETHYVVSGDPEIRLQVGVPSQEISHLHRLHGVDCSAFITAYNPFSAQFSDGENRHRHAELGVRLGKTGLAFLQGQGKHPNNQWPAEASYLVLGMQLEDAKRLGIELEQNAFVWVGTDATPTLILLR